MKNRYFYLALLALFFSNSLRSQTHDPYYEEIVGKCSYDTVLNNLQSFVGFGVKEVGTTALNDAKEWLIDQYKSYGYTDIAEDPFEYSGKKTANIVVTKVGSVYPDRYLIVDAHYDTKNGVGANDNGSGTVLILEIARLLKHVNTEFSIKFIHFSGEEDGLVGSNHYVDNVVKPNKLDIKLVFNIDQVGGVSGKTNNTIVCERDESSPTSNNEKSSVLTNELAKCVSLYSTLSTSIANAYSSDYMPFQSNDEIITGFFEKNESTHPHSSTDIISNMDVKYLHEVTKAAIGGSLHFAVATKSTTAIAESSFLDNIVVAPNPNNGSFTIYKRDININLKVTLRNSLGQVMMVKNFKSLQPMRVNIESPAGIYFLTFETKGGELKTVKVFKQ